MIIEFIMPESRLQEFTDQLEKINKKAAKLNLDESTFEIIGTELKEGPSHTYLKFLNIRLTSFDVKLPGWTFIAKRDHTVSTAMPVIASMYNEEIKKEWYSIPAKCEHCKSNRRRNVTYIVKSDSGECKRIAR